MYGEFNEFFQLGGWVAEVVLLLAVWKAKLNNGFG